MHVVETLGVSARRACRVVGLSRSVLKYKTIGPARDKPLVDAMCLLATQNPDWGYKKIWRLLKGQGFVVNKKRVLRLWQQEGLQVRRKPAKPRKAGRQDNSCHIRKAEMLNQVWSVDFVEDQTMDGGKLKILTVLDDFSREALAVEVERRMDNTGVRKTLKRLIAQRGAPEFIRSDNGSEFIAEALRKGLEELGVETAQIAPGCPWQNGRNERLNGILRWELLDRQVFGSLLEARVMHDRWRQRYNELRPHSAIGWMTPSQAAAKASSQGLVWSSPKV